MTLPADVQAWLDEGAALRASLIEERGKLVDRIAQIDAALAPLGGAVGDPPLAQQVAAVLASSRAPMTAREIRAALPSAARLAIGTALYNGVKRGTIRATGPKGSQRYRAVVPPAPTNGDTR